MWERLNKFLEVIAANINGDATLFFFHMPSGTEDSLTRQGERIAQVFDYI